MPQTLTSLEEQRLLLQAMLDGHKTQVERNRLGQFSTPSPLAQDILNHAKTLLSPRNKINFLDPAIGTGSFFSALCKVFPHGRIQEALGFEIDPHYGKPAARLWKDTELMLKLSDFTYAKPSPRFNLIICNPPYVRHHHLENGNKTRLQLQTFRASGMKLSGLAGLYCHFLGLSHAWMTEGGIAGWLIPSEFMDVNYGQSVKRYLLENVTLLQVHRFDPNDVQFADALVSSAIVWFKKQPPPRDHAITFSFGGTLAAPKLSRLISAKALAQESKWTRFPASPVRSKSTLPTISDFFQIRRGLATGDNGYFILTPEQIAARGLPMQLFRPILPSPRYLEIERVDAYKNGNPKLARRLFLLDTTLHEDEIRKRFPALFAYLQEGKARGLCDRYLCGSRSPWYAQEKRQPAPIVCTYIGRSDTPRGRPFRFILNQSQATAANVYLMMYPTPLLAQALTADSTIIERVCENLNAIPSDHLLHEGRVYGGGLHKLEPKELANVPVPELMQIIHGTEHSSGKRILAAAS